MDEIIFWKQFILYVGSTVPNMDDMYIPLGRLWRNTLEMTNLHYLWEDLFYVVIDMQL